MSLQNLRPKNLQELIKEQIKRFIVDSALKAGEMLPSESSLAERLGVSKTAVREALKGLQNVGIIESKQGVGNFVKSFSYEVLLENLPYSHGTDLRDLRDLLEVRVCLERSFIVQNLSAFSEKDFQDLREICQQLEDATHSRGTQDAASVHAAFHCALFRHTGNRLLIELINIFSKIQRKLIEMNQYKESEPEHFLELHRELIRALEKRDREHVIALMDEHFADVLNWVNEETREVPI